jgi:hypothetical protein
MSDGKLECWRSAQKEEIKWWTQRKDKVTSQRNLNAMKSEAITIVDLVSRFKHLALGWDILEVGSGPDGVINYFVGTGAQLIRLLISTKNTLGR